MIIRNQGYINDYKRNLPSKSWMQDNSLLSEDVIDFGFQFSPSYENISLYHRRKSEIGIIYAILNPQNCSLYVINCGSCKYCIG